MSRPAIAGRAGGAAAVENRGMWKRFFHTCRVARIPLLTLFVYIVLDVLTSNLLVKIPQVNANFFAGDTSVGSVAAFIGAELASVFLGQIMLYAGHVFRYQTNRNLRNVLWEKILRVKPSYYDCVTPTTLLSRITTDTESLNAFIMDVILGIAFSVYMLFLTLQEMSGISLRASFLLLGFVPLFLLINFVMGRLNLKFQNAARFRMADLTGYLSELMASLPLVKAFNRQNYESKRGRQVIDEYYASSRNLVALDFGRQMVSAIIGILPEIVIIIMGIRLLQDGTVDTAGWYTFYLYAGTLLTFVSGLGTQWESIKGIQGQMNRISEVLFQPEEGVEPYVNEITDAGDISFDDVSFAYGGDAKALEHISFTIPAMQTTALVGYSGAGKSTILKLLERVYDPDSGRILVGGTKLQDIGLDQWRRKIAYVPQNAPMISGTLRENLLYGIRREVSEDEIWTVLKEVRLDAFVRQDPDGLDRQVGAFGGHLSGGQRQKVSVARAILSQPEILILDEPTASLDPISAADVADAVAALRHTMTIVMIAHQPRVLRDTDHVVVLDRDHTAIEGTGADLLETNAFYRELMGREAAVL